MALPGNREIDITDAVDGQVGLTTKRAGEKFIHAIKCGSWIGSRGAVTGTPTATVAPTDATNAPTVTVGIPVNNNFNVTVDAGHEVWNTSGQGTITLLITFANGEKREIVMPYKIIA